MSLPNARSAAAECKAECMAMTMKHYVLCSGPTISEAYVTEYSTDKIEMHIGAINEGDKVLLVSPVIRSYNVHTVVHNMSHVYEKRPRTPLRLTSAPAQPQASQQLEACLPRLPVCLHSWQEALQAGAR
jgi:hypothetical protein